MQFDLNYTFSKSIDLASDAERVGTIGGLGGQIINAWDPYQFRAPSDSMRHINSRRTSWPICPSAAIATLLRT